MVTTNAPARTTNSFGAKLALGLVVALVLVIAVIVATTIIISRSNDLSIADTAIDFETAVHGRNYEAMWDLSAGDYRRGLSRDAFIEWARENTPEPSILYEWTALNETAGDIGRVHTHFLLSNGDLVTNVMALNRIDGEWRVISYAPYDGPWPPDETPLEES